VGVSVCVGAWSVVMFGKRRILRNRSVANKVERVQNVASVSHDDVVLVHCDPILLPCVGHRLRNRVAARVGVGRCKDDEEAHKSECLRILQKRQEN
jgi:hypothetical protein